METNNDSTIECDLVRPICTRYEISISMVSAFVAMFHRIEWYLFMTLFSVNYKQTRYTKFRLSSFAQKAEIKKITRCLLFRFCWAHHYCWCLQIEFLAIHSLSHFLLHPNLRKLESLLDLFILGFNLQSSSK